MKMKRTANRAISVLLSLIMILSVFTIIPVTASAESLVVTGDMTSWSDNTYCVTENVTIEKVVSVTGTVTLILGEGTTLTCAKGIRVEEGNSLTIDGTGVLVATGTSRQAGIGSYYSVAGTRKPCGSITINGGTITATGNNAAGIGNARNLRGGEITINGGSITATGKNGSAGIGDGAWITGGPMPEGDMTRITITGGTVEAKGSLVSGAQDEIGAAIGGGAISNDRIGSDAEVHVSGAVKVSVGSSADDLTTVNPLKRSSACAENRYCEIRPCDHSDMCMYYTAASHFGGCYCGAVVDEEPHEFNENGDCVCGLNNRVPHLDGQGVSQPSEACAFVLDTTASLESGWYAVREDVTLSDRLTVSGTVHLILCDGATLTAASGVTVAPGGSLCLYVQNDGTGVLEAYADGSENAFSGDADCLVFYEGAQVRAGSDAQNCTVANADDRVSACTQNAWVRIEHCRSHSMENGACTVCGYSAKVVSYVDAAGQAQTPVSAYLVGSETLSWTEGWYAVRGDVVLTDRVSVSGDVNLILCDGATLTANDGISVLRGNSLTIWAQTLGTGALSAKGARDCAGIGSGDGASCGAVTVNGGVITARGGNGDGGAGIGCGYIGYGCSGDGGEITINGGAVTATGTSSGAGIGGASHGSGGVVTINGGTIFAEGNSAAAGIGSGGDDGTTGGTIAINGGRVTARSSSVSYGIGGGALGAGGTIRLSWTEKSDYIEASYNGDVTLAKSFLLADTNEEATTANIGGHRIVPAVGTVSDVAVSHTENGELTADVSRAVTGQRVTLTWSAEYPTHLSGLTVTKAGGGTVPCVQKDFFSWYFLMPDVSVSVLGVFSDYTTVNRMATDGTVWGCLPLTQQKADYDTGNYAVTEDLYFPGRLYISGDVNLYLDAGTTLTCAGGITVAEGNSLTVDGPGTLIADASGNLDAAGIGGGLYGQNAGTIVIKNGTVTATGGYYGNGIGGAFHGSGGTVRIEGGKVTAAAGPLNGYGIGDGAFGSGGSVVLGWTSPDDFIEADSYRGAVSYAKRKLFYEAGTANLIDPSQAGGKRLVPCTESVYLVSLTQIGGGSAAVDRTNVLAGQSVNLTLSYGFPNTVQTLTILDAENHPVSFTQDGNTCTFQMPSSDVHIHVTFARLPRVTETTSEGAQNCIPITADAATLETDWYTLTEDLTLGRLTVSGDVHLYLPAGKTLSCAGITVNEGNSLTIEGGGTLNAVSNTYQCAGIGGDAFHGAGTITILSGAVNATGAYYGAGIGGGCQNGAGTIDIRGGTVTATGGNFATGIGCGSSGSGGTVKLLGGQITASTPDNAVASIGGQDAVTVLGWTNTDDFIEAGGYSGTVLFAANKYFSVEGSAALARLSDVGGRRIVPYAGDLYTWTLSQEGNYGNLLYLVGLTVEEHVGDEALTLFPAGVHLTASIDALYEYNKGTREFTGLRVEGADGSEAFAPVDFFYDLTDYFTCSFTMPAADATLYPVLEEVTPVLRTTSEGEVSCYPLISMPYNEAARTRSLDSHDWWVVTKDTTIELLTVYYSLDSQKNPIYYFPKLYIDEGATLTLTCGMKVEMGNSITIEGSGSLVTLGRDARWSGIGGGGDIIIRGCNITARGGVGCSGIGGGHGQPDISTGAAGLSSNVRIEGGNVTAIGGTFGAGIGSSFRECCGEITITGGTVTAIGGASAAGIGGGYAAPAGNITINGGTVNALGGTDGAGIGGGDAIGGYSNPIGTITINGGTVNAVGGGQNTNPSTVLSTYGAGAGIGGGSYGAGGTIIINGGQVTARGDRKIDWSQSGHPMLQSAGIGDGWKAGGGSIVTLGWTIADDSITASIYDGTVTLTKDFEVGDAVIPAGAVSDTSAINGKTLSPPKNYIEKYPLHLGEVQVTSVNKDDILVDGRASFDPTTNTLTLNDPVIPGETQLDIFVGKIVSDGLDLTIKGSYHMTSAETLFGLLAINGSVTLDGDFTFMGTSYGIGADINHNVTLRSGSLKALGTGQLSYGITCAALTIGENASRLEAQGDFTALYFESDSAPTIPETMYIRTPEGGVIKNKKLYEADGSTVAKTAVFARKPLLSDLEGNGTEETPYLIKNAADWELLGDAVAYGIDTSGKYFTLTNDISVTTMIGTPDNPFKGIFDGYYNGRKHTLTVDITSDIICCAPFARISGATIQLLDVTGKVNGAIHCSGLVGGINGGNNLIQCCGVGVDITTSGEYCGGLVGHGGTYDTTINESAFYGTITGAARAGTIWGWSDAGTTLKLKNCVDLSESDHPIGLGYMTSGSEVTNTYYTNPDKTAGSERPWTNRGKFAYTVSPGKDARIFHYGSVGVQWGENVYAAACETVTMNGYGVRVFSATAGTFKQNGSNLTLTMPEQDVTINIFASWMITKFMDLYGTSGNSGEGHEYFVDGQSNTKWCVSNINLPISVTFKANSAFVPAGYVLVTANDTEKYPERNPVSWKLEGSNDYTNWTVLTEEEDNYTLEAKNYFSYSFGLTNQGTTRYQYYRFTVSKIKDKTTFQLSGLYLFYLNDTHTINLDNGGHGTVGTNYSSAVKGETVTFIATPDNGYELDKITVKDTDGNDIELNGNSFIMPDKDVTVYAEWKKTAPDIVKGDITGDGEVDSLDATSALKYDAGIIDLNAEQLAAGDVNGDGEVDSLDATMILKYDAGIIDEL